MASFKFLSTVLLDAYEQVTWLSEIPQEKGCFFYGWSSLPGTAKDTWIEISKPKILPVPIVPTELAEWVILKQISDSSLQRPELSQTRMAEEEFANPNNTSEVVTKTVAINLTDHPELLVKWEEYIKNKWTPWAQQDRVLRQIQKVYSELYAAYLYQQRMGESYEAVLSLGYLTWKTPNSQTVRRHILTAQTQISFDPSVGRINVGPSAEGPNITLEQDMLEPEERPDSNEVQVIESLIENLDEDITNKEAVDTILRSWINTIPNSLGYDNQTVAHKSVETTPKIAFAPALILRHRTERSLVRAFKEIIEQLKSNENIPRGLLNLVNDPDKEGGSRLGSEHDNPYLDSAQQNKEIDNEIYFPLLANDEQIEIAKQLRTNKGVLVQGPPGTGKSHTIANLICHLLATGQRVLVTSHTSRALVVLREKIPKEISPLCVIALSDDAKSLKALEASVTGITEKHNTWNLSQNQKDIERLQRDIESARRDEAKAFSDFRVIREAETLKHISKFGCYSGSLKTIAQQIRQKEPLYSWVGEIDENVEPPINDEEMGELLRLLQNATELQEVQAEQYVPNISDLPTGQELAFLFKNEKLSQNRLSAYSDIRSSSEYLILEKCDASKQLQLQTCLNTLISKIKSLSEDIYPWSKDVVQQVLAGKDGPFRELHRVSSYHIESIGSCIDRVGNISVTGLDKRDRKIVSKHASSLLNHMASGGSLGWWKLRPKAVSEALYLIEEVCVDGEPCSNPLVLQSLIEWIILNDHFDSLEKIWAGISNTSITSIFSVMKAEYESKLNTVDKCLSVGKELSAAKNALSEMPSLLEPRWHNIEQIEKLIKILVAIKLRSELQENSNKIERVCNWLQEQIHGNSNIHPITNELLSSVKVRDANSYSALLQALRELGAVRNNINRKRSLLSKLSTVTPNMADTIITNANNEIWAERFMSFTSAWNWSRANSWIARVADPSDQQQLKMHIDQLRSEIQRKVAELSAAKAWRYCLARLTDHESGHLRAWQLAVKRIGKGGSVRVNEYRREARKHMEECRTAIPAWIMPIYRVAETIEMKPDIFDVVIVDEASQSGPEALFLQYIAKKIVVVGDNKQISPQFVGLSKDDVALLRQRLIADIPFNDALGIENSFFDQAFIRYKGQICLREHFRCMPEIIQFSNNLCYSSTPLIPLKQFGAGRITPTVAAKYVEAGYQKGRSPKTTNPPEAEAVAEFIAKCCTDSKYSGKTFGVISLMGEDQAKFIYTLLLEKLGPTEMEKREIICGDAYAFQGDERDIIVLSMVSAPGDDHRIGTLTKADDEKRFNVAASRAKEQMVLFHSATLDDLNPICLRYKLLKYCLNPKLEPIGIDGYDINSLRSLAISARRDIVKQPHPFGSWFELDVFLDIITKGYRVIPQLEVAGYKIDLVVEGMRGRLAVECDGDYWHGPDQYEQDMARQRQLERSGYVFWRIRESTYYRDPQAAMNSLWDTLKDLQIFTSAEEEEQLKQTNAVTYASIVESSNTINTLANAADTGSARKINPIEISITSDVIELDRAKVSEIIRTDMSQQINNIDNLPEEETDDISNNDVNEEYQKEFELSNSTGTVDELGILDPYVNWIPQPIPDPRVAPIPEVMKGIVGIIKAEGPIICHRAYKLYVNACGIQRVGKQLRSVLNKAVSKAIRDGLIKETNEFKMQDQIHKVVRITDCVPVLLRARGDRTLEEIPPFEIAEMMKVLIKSDPGLRDNTERLYRSVLSCYGLVRMTTNTKNTLDKALSNI